jgi:hypothetical protein
MEPKQDAALDQLWQEYGQVFREFDDLTLARWMAQTLSQLQGKVWRLSHPLLSAYRVSGQVAHERQIWLKRLAGKPAAYSDAPCCRAPLLPLFTRDIREDGLLCLHCGEPMVPFTELPPELQADTSVWARQYDAHHQVAHWDENQRRRVADHDKALDAAAAAAEKLLVHASQDLLPRFLAHYPALVWEDHDECLDVRPEDILPPP